MIKTLLLYFGCALGRHTWGAWDWQREFRAIYYRRCAVCHKLEMRGELCGDELEKIYTPEEIAAGGDSPMNAFFNFLSWLTVAASLIFALGSVAWIISVVM